VFPNDLRKVVTSDGPVVIAHHHAALGLFQAIEEMGVRCANGRADYVRSGRNAFLLMRGYGRPEA
jgi:hypothetical protein